MLSIIIPVLNEADQIEKHLKQLQNLRHEGYEIIVVDGGSYDNTSQLAIPLSDQVLTSEQGRALQMNLGAKQASGNHYLFLHADTYLPEDMNDLINLCKANNTAWGRFDMRLSGNHWAFRIIEACMNIRSRLTGIATGDQAIFVSKTLFEQVGGYPEIALMEDIAICKLLKKIEKPICLKQQVTSSSRRWEQHGIIRTISKMWLLRLLYFIDCDTNKLAEIYK